MKAIPFIFLLAVLMSFSPNKNYTESTDLEYNWIVISTGGVEIKESPDPNSKTIAMADFLDTLTAIRGSYNVHDTLRFTLYSYYNEEEEIRETWMKAAWVKVKHEEVSGFVLNSHLKGHNPRYRSEKRELLDYRYGLTLPGYTCFENIHPNKNMKWYGLYRYKLGYKIKEVEIDYHTGNMSYLTTTNQDRDLIFLLGSSNDRLIPGEVEGDRWKYSCFNHQYATPPNNKYGNIELREEGRNFRLYLKENGKEQLLNPEALDVSYPRFVFWVGDIDRDGAKDYIIHYGEKNSSTVLYLSSAAGEGEIVRPVAIYKSGYCC